MDPLSCINLAEYYSKTILEAVSRELMHQPLPISFPPTTVQIRLSQPPNKHYNLLNHIPFSPPLKKFYRGKANYMPFEAPL